MESLKNLALLQSLTTPLSTAARDYYVNTFAQGSGPDGTYLLTDFLGTATGTNIDGWLQSSTSIIAARTTDGTLAGYIAVLDNILGTVDGSFGDPVLGPVTIPSGPGAGVYTDANDALAVLIPLANSAISSAATAMGSDATTLNTNWSNICDQVVYETGNQSKASLQITNLIAGDQLSVLALTTNLGSIGLDTQEGMSAQFFEQIADTSIISGQAIIGSCREGRNNAEMDEASVKHDNIVPDQPAEPPPQATLLDAEYTVAEARIAAPLVATSS